MRIMTSNELISATSINPNKIGNDIRDWRLPTTFAADKRFRLNFPLLNVKCKMFFLD